MSQHTNIQWTDGTINPTSGCDGCEILPECYAHKLHVTRLASVFPTKYDPNFLHVRMIPGRMAQAAAWSDLAGKDREDKPWLNGLPRHVFISDMSDALSAAVPFEYLVGEIICNVISEPGRRHIWQWLTKRPDRMAEFDGWLKERGVDWPENLWAGTSVTKQRYADGRIPPLLKMRAAVRFLSIEPLRGPVVLPEASLAPQHEGHSSFGINWVIVGGESGPAANEHPMGLHWARALRDQCAAAGTPFFLKQLGGPRDHRGAMSDFPEDLRVRQMPAINFSPCQTTS